MIAALSSMFGFGVLAFAPIPPTPAQAERAAADFERRLAQLAATPPARAPSVFVQIWDHPLMTVNGQHLISDVLAACGARNAFSALPALAGSVDLEAELVADPDVILVAAPPGRDAASLWRRLPRLRAARDGRIRQIDPDLITRASPRILGGVEQVLIAPGARPGVLRDALAGTAVGTRMVRGDQTDV